MTRAPDIVQWPTLNKTHTVVSLTDSIMKIDFLS